MEIITFYKRSSHSRYYLFLILVLSSFISCSLSNKSTSEREKMIKVAKEFLNHVKDNDAEKAKKMLANGVLDRDEEGFTYNVNLASEALKKYGFPSDEKITFDSSLHSEPLVVGVVFPIYSANSTEEDLQSAVTKVFVNKESGKYKVIFFANEFESKMTPIEP